MTTTICSVEECDRPAKTRGLCPGHYMRLLKGKDLAGPLAPRAPKASACKVAGCDKPVFSRAMCAMHYNRLRNYGSIDYQPGPRHQGELPALTCVMPGCDVSTRKRALCDLHAGQWDQDHPLRRGATPAQKLEARTLKTEGCWYWVGTLSEDYYAEASIKGVHTRMHRIAWELHHGRPVPEGLQIDHSCHITYCVMPLHLRTATPHQNADHRKGPNRGNISGYRGVTWSQAVQQWQGRFMLRYVSYQVGYFDDPREAFLEVERQRREKKIELGLLAPGAEE